MFDHSLRSLRTETARHGAQPLDIETASANGARQVLAEVVERDSGRVVVFEQINNEPLGRRGRREKHAAQVESALAEREDGSVALLPLGLPAGDPFWTGPTTKTTWEKAWSGEDLAADKAIKSPRP